MIRVVNCTNLASTNTCCNYIVITTYYLLAIDMKGINMKTQKGYYNLDLGGLMVGLLIAGVFVGVVLAYAIPWLWSYVKPIIHALTA